MDSSAKTATHPNVGAGLPAMAQCQSKMYLLMYRIRGQARSHISPPPHFGLITQSGFLFFYPFAIGIDKPLQERPGLLR